MSLDIKELMSDAFKINDNKISKLSATHVDLLPGFKQLVKTLIYYFIVS